MICTEERGAMNVTVQAKKQKQDASGEIVAKAPRVTHGRR
jgi:hypothetical protein